MLSFLKRRLAPAAAPVPEQRAAPAHVVVDAAHQAAAALVAGLYDPASVAEVLAALRATGFSEHAYFRTNPDLQAAFPNAERAMLHFLSMVKIERRKFPMSLAAPGLAGFAALATDDRSLIAGVLASLADAAVDMGVAPRLEKLREVWPAVQDCRRLGALPYIIVGDSHSTFYRRSTANGENWLLPLHVCCSGGSATGLGNPRSRSGYGGALRALMEFLQTAEGGADTPLLIQFGQVDLEFVHPFRRVKQARQAFDIAEFTAFSEDTIRAYMRFLKNWVAPARRGGVTVLGVFPPALSDETLRAGYINDHIAELEGVDDRAAFKQALASLDWPDLPTRTRLHAAHNTALAAAVLAAGFNFLADFTDMLSPQGVLDRRLIPSGQGRNHHIDFMPSEALLAGSVWRLLQPDAPPTRVGFHELAEMPDPALLPPLDHPDLDRRRLTPAQAQWVEDGVVIRRKFLPDSLLDPYIARRAAFRPGTAWNAVGWPDGNCYEGVAELRDVALHPPLMALLAELIGEPMLLHLALTGWLSTERDWHQDDYLNPPFINTWYAAVWIALGDITPKTGPFEYVPGSHRWPLLRGEKVRAFLTREELRRRAPTTRLVEWPKYAERFLSPAIEEQITASGLPVVPFLAEKGDILIWHSRLMHRGSKRTEEWDVKGDKVFSRFPRKALITHYSGINHRPDMTTREIDWNGESFAVFNKSLALD